MLVIQSSVEVFFGLPLHPLLHFGLSFPTSLFFTTPLLTLIFGAVSNHDHVSDSLEAPAGSF